MQLFLLLITLAAAVVSEPVHETDQSLLWGPYRPNLYFGIRPRLPQSLMTGLMWFSTLNYQSVQSAFAILTRSRGTLVLIVAFQGSRHACEQDDKLDSYTWTQYDPREGGVQEIKDSENNVKITTEFLKVPGGKNGGSWAARIKGEPMDACERRQMNSILDDERSHATKFPTAKPMYISTVFYSGLEGLGGLEMQNDPISQVRSIFFCSCVGVCVNLPSFQGFDGPVTFIGSTPDLDDFTIRIEDDPGNVYVDEASRIGDSVGRTSFAGYRVERGDIWQAKSDLKSTGSRIRR